MSSELAQTLQAALDDGCSLSELEATLLARADTDDRIGRRVAIRVGLRRDPPATRRSRRADLTRRRT